MILRVTVECTEYSPKSIKRFSILQNQEMPNYVMGDRFLTRLARCDSNEMKCRMIYALRFKMNFDEMKCRKKGTSTNKKGTIKNKHEKRSLHDSKAMIFCATHNEFLRFCAAVRWLASWRHSMSSGRNFYCQNGASSILAQLPR